MAAIRRKGKKTLAIEENLKDVSDAAEAFVNMTVVGPIGGTFTYAGKTAILKIGNDDNAGGTIPDVILVLNGQPYAATLNGTLGDPII